VWAPFLLERSISLVRQRDIPSELTSIGLRARGTEVIPEGPQGAERLEDGAAVDGVSTCVLSWSAQRERMAFRGPFRRFLHIVVTPRSKRSEDVHSKAIGEKAFRLRIVRVVSCLWDL